MKEITGKSCLGRCIIALAAFFAIMVLIAAGKTLHGQIGSVEILIGVAVIVGLIFLFMHKRSQNCTSEIASYKQCSDAVKNIANKYNKQITQLETDFNEQTKGLRGLLNKNKLRETYSDKYGDIRTNFITERNAYLEEWNKTHGKETALKKLWKTGFAIIVAVMAGAGIFSLGLNMPPETEQSRLAALMDNRTWSAENIPMPHMQDHSLYVSNPDSILSPSVVDSINATLLQLDDSLGIESAFVIVGHIKNDDPVSLVRGIYEKYKVGRNDRGLVVVVGYLDHSYFIAPGRSLEADLTDLECNHLAQDYLIPGMKAEQPDSGMLYLAKGVYALLSSKERPQMAPLARLSDNNDSEESSALLTCIYFALLMGVYLYYHRQGKKFGWTGLSALSLLYGNPFYTGGASSGGSYGGYSSSGGGGFSSGSSGGYGGGSWGGGGSGGRW